MRYDKSGLLQIEAGRGWFLCLWNCYFLHFLTVAVAMESTFLELEGSGMASSPKAWSFHWRGGPLDQPLQFLQGTFTSVISQTDRSFLNGRLMDREPITGSKNLDGPLIPSPILFLKCLYYTEQLDTSECLPSEHYNKMPLFPLAFTLK